MLVEVAVPPSQFAEAVASRHRREAQDQRTSDGPRDGGRFAGLFGSAPEDGSVLLRAAVARFGDFEVVSAVVPPGTDGRSASYKALTPSIPGAALVRA